jgi:hypothetical protein
LSKLIYEYWEWTKYTDGLIIYSIVISMLEFTPFNFIFDYKIWWIKIVNI